MDEDNSCGYRRAYGHDKLRVSDCSVIFIYYEHAMAIKCIPIKGDAWDQFMHYIVNTVAAHTMIYSL